MKAIRLCICFLGLYICSPAHSSGEESLLIKTIQGRSKAINSVAFSPDGKYGASGGVDNTLNIWRLEDGSPVRTLKGHGNSINSVVFSPDGGTIASASSDGTVRLWKVKDGALLYTLKGHRDDVWSVAFFPDGENIASGGEDGTVRIWRVGAGTPGETLKGRSGAVYSVSISSDGRNIASAGAAHTIKIWDAGSGRRIRTLEGHSGSINSVSYSPAGNYLASGSDDGLVKIWRLRDGLCVKTLSGRRKPVLSVAYSPDGAYVFSGGGDNAASAWRTSDGALMKTFEGHVSSVKSVALSPDGKYLASGGFDKTMKIWLTPWEADNRDREIRKTEETAAERNQNYGAHYAAGLQLLSAPTWSNLKKSKAEFAQALSYRRDKDCEEKLKEAENALNRKELEIKRMVTSVLKYLLVIALLLTIAGWVSGFERRARSRRVLPGEIKKLTLSGNYEKAFNLYTEYKEIGGEPKNLPREELLMLYREMRALDELCRENLPYDFLLSYAAALAEEGNYKIALSMLRSGKLLDEFGKPGDYDAFVGIYEKSRRPENLLMFKFRPGTYTGLAEAFLKARSHDLCEKMCALKKQFYAKKFSPRDNELLSACRQRGAPAGPAAPSQNPGRP